MSKSHLNSPASPARPGADLRAKVTSPVSAVAAANGNPNIKEVKPNREQIQRRAYELYCQRSARGENGTPEMDWLAAERELTRKT